jgi:hypothetical protein
MRSKDQTVAEIFTTIERLERELASLKDLVQQAVSKETIRSDIFIDATFIDEADQEILFDAEILDDRKPKAKTKEGRRLEGQQRARDWAELERKKKGKTNDTRNQS